MDEDSERKITTESEWVIEVVKSKKVLGVY